MSDAVTYTATLPVARATVEHLADLLADHQRQIDTRERRRSLGCFAQAVAFLRWMLNATEVIALARDNAIGLSTSYRYIDEALAVVAAQAPELHQALEAAREAGYRHVMIDGTLIATDRSRSIGPTKGVDQGIPPLAGEGGQARPTTTAPTSRWSPPPTAGRSTPPRCARDASTTPPARAPMKGC